jgi:hypothetical protein
MFTFGRKPRPAATPAAQKPTSQNPAKTPLANPPWNQRALSINNAATAAHEFARTPLLPPAVQRKPVLSSPGDPCEREADEVADQVLRMAEPASRPERAEREAEKANPIQLEHAPSAKGGAPLSATVRDFFEPRFGHDFSRVRVHTDAEAVEAAHAVQARAYTVGHDIVFGSGEYAPATTAGRKLLAHELAHVAQSSGSIPARILRQPQPQPAPPQPAPPPPAPATTVALTGSVGDGGANSPADVRAVQDRLLALGFLSPADHTAEVVNVPQPPTGAPPPTPAPAVTPPQPVAVTTIPRTMRAIQLFSLSAVGQPLLLIVPGGPLEAALNVAPITARGMVGLTGSIGVGGANAVADVRAVQDRLLATGYLAAPDHRTESAAIAAITGAVADSAIPHTLGALLHALRDAASTATQVAPGSAEERAINAPPGFAPSVPALGRVTLTATVGGGGTNNVDDVRALQARLRELGYLTEAALATERPGRHATSPVADASIPQTLTAIARFQDETLGPGVAVPANQIGPGTAGAAALNAPPHRQIAAGATGTVQITAAVGDGAANAPADVRAVQDRLFTIGLLTAADYTAEQVNVQTAQAPVTGIPQTLAAIQRFEREVASSSLSQIRPGRDVELLNQPPRFRRASVEIGASVGTGGTNAPADVRTVQERLHDLGYLSDAGFAAEAASPTAAANVNAAAMPLSIAALTSLQTTLGLGRVTANGLVTPGDVTHRLLVDPRLPIPMTATLTAAVGTGGVNNPADVLLVQSRLRELGILGTSDFLTERPAAGAAGPVAAASLTQTIAAIDDFVSRAVGVAPNGRLDAGSMAARVLADPTYGTLTTINPNATNAAAGPPPGIFTHEVQQIIQAVETIEAGQGGRGERPAELQNASKTPASFGKSQLIGGTAVATLRSNPAFAATYGLDRGALGELNDIAARTVQNYDAIFALVPAPGLTEANLQTAIANFIATDGPRFHKETGLFDSDVANMFRIAQLRRHLEVARAALSSGLSGAARSAAQLQAVTDMMNAATHPDEEANIRAIGFTSTTVLHYLRNPLHLGENKQGFVTRALFTSRYGQQLRNAMTDNSGIAIGRQLLADNFALVTRRAAALRVALTAAQRAEVTARTHNSGSAQLNDFINDLPATHNDGYVARFRRVWVP